MDAIYNHEVLVEELTEKLEHFGSVLNVIDAEWERELDLIETLGEDKYSRLISHIDSNIDWVLSSVKTLIDSKIIASRILLNGVTETPVETNGINS